MDIEEHKKLNEHWKDKYCKNCGRKYPDTILNIEQLIHHNNLKSKHSKLPICLDIKDCNKFIKKHGK